MGPATERDKDARRKREARSENARIEIPVCVDPQRRAACLADPALFLRTYFADQYRLHFGEDHLFMIDAIVSRARHGGRQAIAAPRGRGKSELVKGLLVYLVLAELVRFPLAVAATTQLAYRLYQDFRKKFATNELLYQDFPEVCHPVRCLEGAPQRAAKQHIDGRLTNIVWTGDYLSLPHVPGSPYGGVKMAYYGLDAAFRGANIDGDRPDFILIDDPETRESARSGPQSLERETIIDQDIAGLVSQENKIAIVVLTTVQNKTPSLSYRLTTPELKPSWNGKKFGMVLKWPTNQDLWEQYIDKRHQDQISGDEHGTNAVKHYLANWDRMNEGVRMLSPHYMPVTLDDGTECVYSAIQQAYNKIADTSLDAYMTEYQNDPPDKAGPQGNGLTWEIVAGRLSGLARYICPLGTQAITAAIDLGKYRCHWVVIAWTGGAGGCVIDYGVAEVTGNDTSMDLEASEPAIYRCLLQWRDELTQKTYRDVSGQLRPVNFVFVDSGTFTNAPYEFCRQVRGIFHPSKGVNPYHSRSQNTQNSIAGTHLHATRQATQELWLYNLDTDYWKQFVHERFLTPTFDGDNMLRPGAMSLWSPDGNHKHHSYAKHITAEELLTEFVDGKGTKTYWNTTNDNNHWLDATYMAAAATEAVGVKLIGGDPQLAPRQVTEKPAKSVKPAQKHGNQFRTRPGGWMQGIKRRR